MSSEALKIIQDVTLTYNQQLLALAKLGEKTDHTLVYSDEYYLAKEKEVNHTMNLVYYKGIPYGFDVCNNGNLYKMISEFEMIPFDDKKRYYTLYKPYYDMIYNGKSLSDIKTSLEYYKQVCGNYISKEEYEEIIRLTGIRIKSGKSLIYDFRNDTKDLLFELKSQIEEVKGMRK